MKEYVEMLADTRLVMNGADLEARIEARVKKYVEDTVAQRNTEMMQVVSQEIAQRTMMGAPVEAGISNPRFDMIDQHIDQLKVELASQFEQIKSSTGGVLSDTAMKANQLVNDLGVRMKQYDESITVSHERISQQERVDRENQGNDG